MDAHAAGSYLYQKVTEDMPCAGFRMPRTEFGGTALPACVTDRIAAWINEEPQSGQADVAL